MDPNRFDNWTRNRARKLSRRDALRISTVTGAATLLPHLTAHAQGGSPCRLGLHADLAGGPSAGRTYDGNLEFTLDAQGVISSASFTSAGDSFPATGTAIGRAIDIRVELSTNTFLTLTGVATTPISGCPSDAAGVVSGPEPGDIGAWEAVAAAASTTIPPAGSQSGSSPSLNCPPPQSACGANCCPGGATCTNATQGLCSCPDGTEQCGTSCVPACSDGQSLDLDTCTCPPAEAACIPNTQSCANHGQCCSGYCAGGTCFDCAGKVCGEFGCIDPSRDSQNCGNCGTTCVLPRVCNNGVCGCASDGTPCINHNECCSQLCFVSTCTSCSNVTTGSGDPLTFCGEGICVNLKTDIDHCGGCFQACPRTSGGIVCDTGVCHDINNDANYCGFGAKVCAPGQICRFGDCVNQ